jgi:pyrimidine deaminase RibD-like protein
VRDGAIVARGHTQAPYQPHAEPMALRMLEGDLADVTTFVTLEPCSFHQRTPSCAKEMITRRDGSVYEATLDPHPRNRGAGIALLREAGMTVFVGLLEDEARADLGPYLYGAGEPEVGW